MTPIEAKYIVLEDSVHKTFADANLKLNAIAEEAPDEIKGHVEVQATIIWTTGETFEVMLKLHSGHRRAVNILQQQMRAWLITLAGERKPHDMPDDEWVRYQAQSALNGSEAEAKAILKHHRIGDDLGIRRAA